MTPAPPPRRPTSRLAVRERLRAMLPNTADADPSDEPASRRSLAMFLSVVVALVMWFSFSMRGTYPVTMRLPVEVMRTPPGQALRAPPPATATVTMVGDGWTMLSLSRNVPTIRVAADGDQVDLAAALQESGLPAGVQVQSIQPQTIELALDTRTTRRLPIRLRRQITTRQPFDLRRPPALRPDSVLVTGAQSLLGGLEDWPTEVLIADDVDRDIRRRVALADTFSGLLSPAVSSTVVSADVVKYTGWDRALPVEVENLPPGVLGVRFEPATVLARYRVPQEGDDYDRAENSDDFRAVVDYFDIARDTTDGEVPVSARWPADLDVRDVTLTPGRVEYFIQRPAVVDPEDGE